MRELDHKECWVLKNWCFWTVVLEKTLESVLDCKKIEPANPKRNQSWIFIGRTDVEAGALTLATCEEPTHWKRPFLKFKGRKRRGRQRMRWVDGITDSMMITPVFLPGKSLGQRSLVACSPSGLKQLDTIWWLNNNTIISKQQCLTYPKGWFSGMGNPGNTIRVLFAFFFNSFIEISSTCYTIHLFKAYSSMVFSIFTELCNHHDIQF